MRSPLSYFQKNKNKPNKLNLQQMWDMYLLNQDKNLSRTVPRSLRLLYPQMDFKDIPMNDRIALYFNGLSYNAFFQFQALISRLTHGNR